MNTPTEQLIEDIRIKMYETEIPVETIRTVISIIELYTSRYLIKEKETSLVVYDGGDTELVKKFFISKAIQGCTERTLGTYRQVLSFCLKRIGKHIKDITSDDIRALLALLQINGKSTAYIAINQRTLSSFFTWCEKNGYISPNPMNKVEKTKVRNRPEEALSLEQMEKVRSEARSKRDKAFIEMLYSTGCRITELCRLNRADVDFEKMEAQVLGKGKKYRVVYITQRAKYAYLEYAKTRTDKSPALFGYNTESPWSGRAQLHNMMKSMGKVYDPDNGRLEPGIAEKMIRSIGHRCGFRVHPHLIRKTMATQAMMRGMPIDEVRIMLGHESIATTTIYAQTIKNNIKDSHIKYL